MADMNVKPATTHPQATQEIQGMLEMIQTLIDKGPCHTRQQMVPFTSAPSPSRATESCPIKPG